MPAARSPRALPSWRLVLHLGNLIALGLLAMLLAAGCGDGPSAAAPVARFALEPGEDFFAQPFPCDLRRLPEGGLDLEGFPPGEVLIEQVVQAAALHSQGFALGGAIYFSFSEPVEPASLPGPGEESIDPEASLYVLDVDPGSPDRGVRVPLWLRTGERASRFLPANWIGLLPFPGVPLRPGTTYAAVITRRLLAISGVPYRPDTDFATIAAQAGEAPAAIAAQAMFQPLWETLDMDGVPREEVVAATVFTTQRVVDLIPRARAQIRAMAPPALSDLQHVREGGLHHLYEGTYPGPVFQQGDPPYRSSGGEIQVDDAGDPILARTETLRVALSVPKDVMPEAGWPVVLYRHGTGGSYMTFDENGVSSRLAQVKDRDAQVLSRMAVISIDGVVHGPRAGEDGGSPEELFYNFQNPLAGRDNSRQEAIDNFALLRLAEAIDVAAAPVSGDPIRFDPERIYFFGHSQGGITGALFVPFEPRIKAAVLSGTGAHLLLTLLRKRSEIDIPALISMALNDGAYGELDEFHPVLTLLQTYIEPADPLSYAHLLRRAPWQGVVPPSLYLSYGVGDSYTPNLTTRALVSAADIPPAGVIHDAYEALELRGSVVPAQPPVCENIGAGGEARTAVAVQYIPPGSSDGHFVVFDDLTARRQSAGFLASHAGLGCATLVE